MPKFGWRKLIPSADFFRREGRYRIDAYSEFLPPPSIGWKAYGDHVPDPEIFSEDDPFGWKISEYEEFVEVRPGLKQIGRQILARLSKLLDGNPDTGLSRYLNGQNPFWPAELAAEPSLPQERCVTLLPLALSRTQDDKGRIRWTLFGNSEQGPSRAFWKSFWTSPKDEVDAELGIAFFATLIEKAYGEAITGADSLYHAGFRILPDANPIYPQWREDLPSWTERFLLSSRPKPGSIRYLLTFRPFSKLPATIRNDYLTGKLVLLPFPGSLIYWGCPGFQCLADQSPLTAQIPLLLGKARHRLPDGLRVPQSGYFHVASKHGTSAPEQHPHLNSTYRRTHRWDKILRDQDELALIDRDDPLLHVLFSTIPDDLTLYNKPMARNVQLWTEDHHLLLNGPNAKPAQLKEAMRKVESGGLFGYRFLFPAMRVGRHEVYWHRPLVAFRDKAGESQILSDAALGYLTAYDSAKPEPEKAIELWPRIATRSVMLAAINHYKPNSGRIPTILNAAKKLQDAYFKRGNRPLPRHLAQQLLPSRAAHSLESWLKSIDDATIRVGLEQLIEPAEEVKPFSKTKIPDSLTYHKTAQRSFEVSYWKTISALSEGTFLNKNNADCVRDELTRKTLPYHERQLEGLGDYLLAYYSRTIKSAGMMGGALAGEMPFQWQTDFDYSWMAGWLKNQDGPAERNIVMVIPGSDRSRAVVMSDHYDTAYMADTFEAGPGGCGARMAACGADDNHSATAAMMLAAPIFLAMSKAGKLGCDIWLIHLTGEEFPADCLGARALTQRLVERRFQITLPDGKNEDLSDVIVKGLYVSDMIAHNNDRERDIFQISPGADPASFWLAEQAHIATETWNESVPFWNQKSDRVGKQRGRRSPHGAAIPEVAPFLKLSGEIRTPLDPRSTLYNTDGQIFSDAGVPCVLFMENYDINRTGYHDTHDTMGNIDLEYGAAVCAITIESVARAAVYERD